MLKGPLIIIKEIIILLLFFFNEGKFILKKKIKIYRTRFFLLKNKKTNKKLILHIKKKMLNCLKVRTLVTKKFYSKRKKIKISELIKMVNSRIGQLNMLMMMLW